MDNNQTPDSRHIKINETLDILRGGKTINIIKKTTAFIKNSNMVTGSMVNHESWENVVQAAPVMAVLLNQTLPVILQKTVDSQNSTLKTKPSEKYNSKK
ncbi:unnamed protein product, partial [Iphiclides podalirius]